MQRKDYKMQIVLAVASQQSHTRALARQLNTNQTTIARKIHELIADNVVDCKTIGKNKAVFLKNSLEARQAFCAAELLKLSELIERYPLLRSLVEQIQKNPEINMAVLFGSYAKGLATESSDIDVYLEATRIKKEAVEKLDSKLSVKIGKYNKKSILIREIEKSHVVIKGVERFYDQSRLSS